MKNKVYFKNLTCAHCAGKIEADIKALDSVKYAALNFASGNLVYETDENPEDVFKDIKKIVKNREPSAEVTLQKSKKDEKADESEEGGLAGKVLFAAGVILFAAALITPDIPYLKLTLFILAYAAVGAPVLVNMVRSLMQGEFFDENFLMTVASLGAFLIGEHSEAVAVMLFYRVGEFFQDMAVRRSRRSIAELVDIKAETAFVKTADGYFAEIPSEEVKVGDIVEVKAGQKIPLDGIVVKGSSRIDTSALTGESLLRRAETGDEVLSGCINSEGVLYVEVSKPFSESTAAKVLELIENAEGKKAKSEQFITKFSKIYTPAVIACALLLAFVPPIFSGHLTDWIGRALVFLVVSCPCALVLSVPLAFFGGIGRASKSGVLIKGGNYLEALNKAQNVVFDKTGTLTRGVFEVTEVKPGGGVSEAELLEMCAACESFSTHPVSKAIIKKFNGNVRRELVEDFREIAGKGISAKYGGKQILIGNAALLTGSGVEFSESRAAGTVIYAAADGVYTGELILSDVLKSDARSAIDGLRELGIKNISMLTGDNPNIAKDTAATLGIDKFYGGLLPQDKLDKLENIIASGTTVFVGDGINDAPSLARADIGAAMGGLGSDAAVEAADIVLMNDSPSKLVDAVKIARATHKIVIQNIAFALGVKLLVLLLGALGAANMWEAVFADVGVALLAVLNSLRVLKSK